MSEENASLPDIERIEAVVPPLTPAERKLSKHEKHRYDVETDVIAAELEQRKIYARRVFTLCCCWVSGIFVLLLFSGFGTYKYFHFSLSEKVLLAAIGSTTANIFAVFLIIVRYLF